MTAIRDSLVSEFGKLDIVVNNAGIVLGGPVHETSLEQWRKVIAVDLEAVYIGSKLAAEAMIPRRSGRIISISSIQAFMTTGNVGSYNAAKAGVVGLTHSMAYELGKYNILVNAIAPGAIRTGMSGHPDDPEADDTEEDRKASYLARVPLGRNGKPSDIAGAALFLASDDCRYLTGHTLVVDGGYSIALSEGWSPPE
jgi:NAD(P)-dependent dehydrogenase (short-subunit alcohol dehydrogenase family)